jgi:hypothetical protein
MKQCAGKANKFASVILSPAGIFIFNWGQYPMYFKLYSESFWMLNIHKTPESSMCLDDGYKQSGGITEHKYYFETEIRATTFIGFKSFKRYNV